MNQNPNPLVEQLAADLQPVRSIRFRDGVVLISLALLLTILIVELWTGLWRAAWTGQASAFYVMTTGLLFILGCASAGSVIKMASPRVGNVQDGPKWALLMLAVLPVAALVTVLGTDTGLALLFDRHGPMCLGAALAASLLSALVLVYWLRRGAPVSPASAGMQVGVASTALGSFAFGLSCSADGAAHLGIWHVLPVVVGALAGRFFLPLLLRW